MAHAPQHPGGNDAANFIRQIVGDPKNVPDVTLLTGYLGASSEEGHERLYLSTDLANYVEIPKAAILHQAPLPKEQDPHGGVTLWVKKDAALQYKMAPAAQALANYFAGAIQAGAQGAGPVAQPLQPATFAQAVCPVTLPNVCRVTQVHTCDCTVVGPACVTHHATCNCTAARTPCPAVSCGIDCTVFGPACQTHHPFCIPTRNQPGCPFPSEVCTHVGACNSPHPGFCPLPQVAAGAGPMPQGRSFVDCSIVCPTRIGPCLSHHFTCAPCVTQHPLQCSIACPTRLEFSCNPACNITRIESCNPACNVTRFETCNLACHVTRVEVSCVIACNNTNAVFCPVASGVACPQVSLGCPQASVACGGFPGQGGFGGPVAQALPQGTLHANCSPPPFCYRTQWDICQ